MYNAQNFNYMYYKVNVTTLTEAYNFLYSQIPQVGLSLSGTAQNLSITLYLHTDENVGNTIIYDYSAISSRNVDGSPVLLKLLNSMHLYQHSNQTVSLGNLLVSFTMK